jgi:hypothetical protein
MADGTTSRYVLGHSQMCWQAVILAAITTVVVMITGGARSRQARCGLPAVSSWTSTETV